MDLSGLPPKTRLQIALKWPKHAETRVQQFSVILTLIDPCRMTSPNQYRAGCMVMVFVPTDCAPSRSRASNFITFLALRTLCREGRIVPKCQPSKTSFRLFRAISSGIAVRWVVDLDELLGESAGMVNKFPDEI